MVWTMGYELRIWVPREMGLDNWDHTNILEDRDPRRYYRLPTIWQAREELHRLFCWFLSEYADDMKWISSNLIFVQPYGRCLWDMCPFFFFCKAFILPCIKHVFELSIYLRWCWLIHCFPLHRFVVSKDTVLVSHLEWDMTPATLSSFPIYHVPPPNAHIVYLLT